MNTHVVLRPIPKGQETLQPGVEVDASTWRNAKLLVEQRRLQPIDKAVSEPDGRRKPDAKGNK